MVWGDILSLYRKPQTREVDFFAFHRSMILFLDNHFILSWVIFFPCELCKFNQILILRRPPWDDIVSRIANWPSFGKQVEDWFWLIRLVCALPLGLNGGISSKGFFLAPQGVVPRPNAEELLELLSLQRKYIWWQKSKYDLMWCDFKLDIILPNGNNRVLTHYFQHYTHVSSNYRDVM